MRAVGTGPGRVGVEAVPVVGHLEDGHGALPVDSHPQVRGTGVPQGVAHRLLGDAPDESGAAVVETAEVPGLDLAGHLAGLGRRDEVLERRTQPGRAEVGRVDLDQERAQSAQRAAHRGAEAGELLPRRATGLRGRGERERRAGQVLDDRVVQVARDAVALLLDRGADPNKPFVGQLHSYTLCCGDEVNSSPFYRAAVAADVEALKLMIAKGAKIEWSPTEVKKEGRGGAGRGMNANVGKTPLMVALNGGRGAAFGGGPGFDRLGPPPFREASNREPLEAIKVLLAAGADPNAKDPAGATMLHQAVTARQVAIIRELVAKGAKLDAVNKDNLTPLLLAEKPEPPPPPGNNNDPNTYRRKRDSREDVIATLRELMKLGPNDPAPVPPPLPADQQKKADEKKTDEAAQ